MQTRHYVALALFALCVKPSRAQDVVVRVVRQGKDTPVANAWVKLQYGCMHGSRPAEVRRRTDAAGVAVFSSVSLSPREFCIKPEDTFQSEEKEYLFIPATQAGTYSSYKGGLYRS